VAVAVAVAVEVRLEPAVVWVELVEQEQEDGRPFEVVVE